MAKRTRKDLKHWFMKFNVGAWLKDPAISSCSEATRGIWFDLLCAMFESDQCGQLTATMPVLSRLGRTTVPKLRKALDELIATNSADVTFRNSNVTVVNRKMRREFEVRNAIRLRVAKSRQKKIGNAHVTDPSEIRCNTLDIRSNNSKNPSPRRGATSAPKSPGKSARASGVRIDISEEVLADPLRLAQWAQEEARRPDAWISSSEADRANVVATAAKALRATGLRSRVGLFKWIVRERRWEYLRFADEEIAATILAAESTKERAAISEFVEIPKFELPKDEKPSSNVEAIRRAAGKR